MCMRMVTGKPGSNHDLKGLEPARTIPLEDHWEPPNRIFTPLEYMVNRHGLDEDWRETVILRPAEPRGYVARAAGRPDGVYVW